MAKAKPANVTTPAASVSSGVDTSSHFQEPAKGTTVTHNPPVMSDKELIAKTNADNKAKADADKASAAKAKADAKAEKDAETAKAKAEKAAARATAKAERETRIAALAADGKNYTGSMLALADRVKQGVYVVGATGQLRSNDELARALDGISPTDVVRIGLDMLGLEDNPYTKLNIGQQSMNLRNRMRGAIKKETLTIAKIQEYVERNKITVTPAVDPEVKAAAKAQKKADADAAKAAKALTDKTTADKVAADKAAALVAKAPKSGKPLAEPETDAAIGADGDGDAQPQ